MRKTYLAAAVLLAGVLACGSGGGDDDRDDDAGAAGTATQAAPKMPGMNQPARDGKFEFVVTGLDCSKTHVGSSGFGAQAQGKFCLASLTVRNVGKEAQVFDASSQRALDAQGTAYDASGEAAMYVNSNTTVFLNNINPGNSIKGVLPFDVPKDTKIATLELHDSPFSGGVKIKVS